MLLAQGADNFPVEYLDNGARRVNLIPAADCSISMPRCPVVPLLGEPKVTRPGSFFASAMKSGTVRTGTLGLSTISMCISATSVTGVNAVTGSNGILGRSEHLKVWALSLDQGTTADKM